MLMGEKVAPRKDFIKTEARKVRTLTSELAPTPDASTARPASTGSSSSRTTASPAASSTRTAFGWMLHLGDRRSWSELTLDTRFEGWVDVAHGGIVATILDEVMAWSLVAEDNWGVTARMSVELPPADPGRQQIRAEGWIVRIPAAGSSRRPVGSSTRSGTDAGDGRGPVCRR